MKTTRRIGTTSGAARRPAFLALTLAASLVLAACSGGGTTGGETREAPGDAGAAVSTVDKNAIDAAVRSGAKDGDKDELPADETYGSDVHDEGMGVDFDSPASDGKNAKLSDDKGKVVALVFGYTFCPDVCPTNLLRFKKVLQSLGDKAKDFKVYFITVDPGRDTVERMRTYINLFNPPEAPNMLGVVESDKDKLDKMMKAWKITANRIELDDGKYLIDHSAGTYLVDKQGETRLYQPHELTVKELLHDVEYLLDERYKKDGSAEGSANGSAEGSAEGSANGSTEGVSDAPAAGSKDGSTNASAEGSTEGAATGTESGSADGSTDGSADASGR